MTTTEEKLKEIREINKSFKKLQGSEYTESVGPYMDHLLALVEKYREVFKDIIQIEPLQEYSKSGDKALKALNYTPKDGS